MTDRRTESLESVVATSADVTPSVAAKEPAALIELNYPEPTALTLIVKDVARWSGHAFVMEPSVNVKLQIFAPRRLPLNEAYDLFLTSLSVVNLRAVQIGRVVKIVPVMMVVSA